MKSQKPRGGYRERAGRGIQGWFRGIYCSSLWELAFVAYHSDQGSKIIRNKRYWNYNLDGKTKKFYPDFIVNDQLFEIKGRKSASKATIIDIAKQISAPSVIFLFECDLKHMFEYMEIKYGLKGKALSQLYEKDTIGFINCLYCNASIINDDKRRFCSRSCGTKHSRKTKFWSNISDSKIIKQLTACNYCGSQTNNKKFCSSSCSAKTTKNRKQK